MLARGCKCCPSSHQAQDFPFFSTADEQLLAVGNLVVPVVAETNVCIGKGILPEWSLGLRWARICKAQIVIDDDVD